MSLNFPTEENSCLLRNLRILIAVVLSITPKGWLDTLQRVSEPNMHWNPARQHQGAMADHSMLLDHHPLSPQGAKKIPYPANI